MADSNKSDAFSFKKLDFSSFTNKRSAKPKPLKLNRQHSYQTFFSNNNHNSEKMVRSNSCRSTSDSLISPRYTSQSNLNDKKFKMNTVIEFNDTSLSDYEDYNNEYSSFSYEAMSDTNDSNYNDFLPSSSQKPAPFSGSFSHSKFHRELSDRAASLYTRIRSVSYPTRTPSFSKKINRRSTDSFKNSTPYLRSLSLSQRSNSLSSQSSDTIITPKTPSDPDGKLKFHNTDFANSHSIGLPYELIGVGPLDTYLPDTNSNMNNNKNNKNYNNNPALQSSYFMSNSSSRKTSTTKLHSNMNGLGVDLNSENQDQYSGSNIPLTMEQKLEDFHIKNDPNLISHNKIINDHTIYIEQGPDGAESTLPITPSLMYSPFNSTLNVHEAQNYQSSRLNQYSYPYQDNIYSMSNDTMNTISNTRISSVPTDLLFHQSINSPLPSPSISSGEFPVRKFSRLRSNTVSSNENEGLLKTSNMRNFSSLSDSVITSDDLNNSNENNKISNTNTHSDNNNNNNHNEELLPASNPFLKLQEIQRNNPTKCIATNISPNEKLLSSTAALHIIEGLELITETALEATAAAATATISSSSSNKTGNTLRKNFNDESSNTNNSSLSKPLSSFSSSFTSNYFSRNKSTPLSSGSSNGQLTTLSENNSSSTNMLPPRTSGISRSSSSTASALASSSSFFNSSISGQKILTGKNGSLNTSVSSLYSIPTTAASAAMLASSSGSLSGNDKKAQTGPGLPIAMLTPIAPSDGFDILSNKLEEQQLQANASKIENSNGTGLDIEMVNKDKIISIMEKQMRVHDDAFAAAKERLQRSGWVSEQDIDEIQIQRKAAKSVWRKKLGLLKKNC